MTREISLSIVIHQQVELADLLLNDLNRCHLNIRDVVLTINTPETFFKKRTNLHFDLKIIRNRRPKGFGANHNSAFEMIAGDYFGVLNPDLRLLYDPFPELLNLFRNNRVALVAPVVRKPDGTIEDNIRQFPTPLRIAAKAIGKRPVDNHRQRTKPFAAEWAAGMFLLFSSRIFQKIGGFDERFHLYYEDVDICARLKLAGYTIMACPSNTVIHDARRESHRKARYMLWHLQSMVRFFSSRTYHKLKVR